MEPSPIGAYKSLQNKFLNFKYHGIPLRFSITNSTMYVPVISTSADIEYVIAHNGGFHYFKKSESVGFYTLIPFDTSSHFG